MATRKYPPILPAPLGAQRSVSPLPKPRELVRRRTATSVACSRCRRKKIKCDGGRPNCSNCTKSGLTECFYERYQKPLHEALVKVLHLLRTLPESSATELLMILRNDPDNTNALATFEANRDNTSNISAPDSRAGSAALQSAKSTEYDLESELMAKNPNTYPDLPPISTSFLIRSGLVGNIQSRTHDSTFDGGPNTIQSHPATPNPASVPNLTPESDYCVERLRELKVNFWTDIKLTDDFAIGVVSLYLASEHPLLGFFDPHLFIKDLVSQQESFCSRFLFHALMHVACMYSAFDENVMPLAEDFLREAERLWELEKDNDTCLNMAGCALLSFSFVGRDKYRAALLYTKEVSRIGTALHLFGTGATASTIRGDDHNARCYAAWSGFNWNIQPGLQISLSPPTLPVPGGEEFLDQQNGEPAKRATEILTTTTFPAICEFWRIIQQTHWIYYPDHKSPPDNLRREVVEYHFREVIAWVETLPASMLRRQNCPHHVTVFHIWLHSAIMDLFRPYIGTDLDPPHRLKTFSASDSSPDEAYAASVNQLRQLIVHYRINHEASKFSVLWHTGLLYLANATLHNTDDPEWRLYFLLCIGGYDCLRRPFPVSGVIIKGLLSMTLRYTDMPGKEARRILDQLNRDGLEQVKSDCAMEVGATFMVDLELALTDPERARVENMADDFDHLAAFQDFLEPDQMME